MCYKSPWVKDGKSALHPLSPEGMARAYRYQAGPNLSSLAADQPSDWPTTKDCSALVPNLSTAPVGTFILSQISSLGCGWRQRTLHGTTLRWVRPPTGALWRGGPRQAQPRSGLHINSPPWPLASAPTGLSTPAFLPWPPSRLWTRLGARAQARRVLADRAPRRPSRAPRCRPVCRYPQ
jgi:hypothetical protein